MLQGSSQVILPTKNGALVVKRAEEMAVKPHLVAVTWGSSAQLYPDQRRFVESLPAMLVSDPWHQAAFLAEMYGRVSSPRVR